MDTSTDALEYTEESRSELSLITELDMVALQVRNNELIKHIIELKRDNADMLATINANQKEIFSYSVKCRRMQGALAKINTITKQMLPKLLQFSNEVVGIVQLLDGTAAKDSQMCASNLASTADKLRRLSRSPSSDRPDGDSISDDAGTPPLRMKRSSILPHYSRRSTNIDELIANRTGSERFLFVSMRRNNKLLAATERLNSTPPSPHNSNRDHVTYRRSLRCVERISLDSSRMSTERRTKKKTKRYIEIEESPKKTRRY